MSKISVPSLVLVAIVAGLGAATSNTSVASLATHRSLIWITH